MSDKKNRQLDHKEGWGKSFVSNKGRLANKSLEGVLTVQGLEGQGRGPWEVRRELGRSQFIGVSWGGESSG